MGCGKSHDIKISDNPYTYKRVLGHGAFGVVVKCSKYDKDYVMKVQNKNNLIPESDDYIFGEHIILELCDHPYIMDLVDVIVSNETVTILSTYDESVNITQLGCLNNNDTVYYTAQLVSALLYLHKNMIIHRDIKTSNILITVKGHIKLVDFGAAIKSKVGFPVNASLYGTRQYMAPEILVCYDSAKYSPSSDWWSIGVVIYKMIKNDYPYTVTHNMGNPIFPISDTYDSLNDQLQFINHMSICCDIKNCILQLLTLDEELRLGNKITDHAMFKNIDWDNCDRNSPSVSVRTIKFNYRCDTLDELLNKYDEKVSRSLRSVDQTLSY